MSVNAPNSMRPVQVDSARNAEQRFVFSPENNDIFVKTGRQVLAACQLADDVAAAFKAWQGQFGVMLEFVADWANRQAERVRNVVVVGRGGKLILMLLPTDEAFDFDLAEASSDLRFDLMKLFSAVGEIDILQVPVWDWQRFFGRDEVIASYGPVFADAPEAVEAQP